MDDLPPPDPNLFEINKNPAEPSKWGLKAMSKSQDLHWDSPGFYGFNTCVDSLSP